MPLCVSFRGVLPSERLLLESLLPSTSHLRTGTRTPSSSLESALLATAHNAFPTWGAKGVARGHMGFVQGVGRGRERGRAGRRGGGGG